MCYFLRLDNCLVPTYKIYFRCLRKQFTWLPESQENLEVNREEDLIKLEELMYSIRCQNCLEGFPVIVGPGSTLKELKAENCDKCCQKPSEENLELYLEIKTEVEKILSKTDIYLGEPEECMRSVIFFENIGTINGFLNICFRKMTGILYPLHILYVKSAELAFEDCIYGKKWAEAVDYGTLCLNSYKKYTIGDQVQFKFFEKVQKT